MIFDNYASRMYIGNYKKAFFSKSACLKLLSIFASNTICGFSILSVFTHATIFCINIKEHEWI